MFSKTLENLLSLARCETDTRTKLGCDTTEWATAAVERGHDLLVRIKDPMERRLVAGGVEAVAHAADVDVDGGCFTPEQAEQLALGLMELAAHSRVQASRLAAPEAR